MPANSSTIGRLIVELLFDGSSYDAGTKKAENRTLQMSKRLNGLTKLIEDGVTKAFKGLTLAVAGFTAASAVVGADFQQKMANIAAITGATDEQFASLTAQARKLGATTEFTAVQAAEALTELAKAGASVEESITASQAALLLAGTTGSSLAGATGILVATQRQFGLEVEESTRITDVFSKAMRTSLLDFESLREAFKFGGTAGAAFGMSLEETTASIAAFRDLGLEGSLAGTNFRMALVAAAKGTQRSAAALKQLGLVQKDINPASNSFAQILDKIGAAGINAQQALDIFGTRAGANIAQLATQTREGQIDIAAFTEELMNSGGQTEQMYARIGNTVAFQSKLAISALQDLMISVFDSFAGPMQEAIEVIPGLLNSVAQAFQKTSGDITKRLGGAVQRLTIFLRANEESLANTFVNVADAVSRLVVGLLDLIPLLDDIAILVGTAFAAIKVFKFVSAISALIPALATATTSLTLFGTAVTVSTGGLAALAAAVVVVVGGLATYAANASQATRDTQALTEAQRELDEMSTQLAATEENRLNEVLKRQNEKIRTLLESGKELSDSTRARLTAALEMTAAEARLGEVRGDLIEVNGFLVDTETAITDGGRNMRDMVKDLGNESLAQAENTGKLADRIEKLAKQFDAGAGVGSGFYTPMLNEVSKALGRQVTSVEEAIVAVDDLREKQQEQGQRGEALLNKAASAQANTTAQIKQALLDEQRELVNTGSAVEDLTEKRLEAAAKTAALEKELFLELEAIGATEQQRRLQSLQARIDVVNETLDAEVEANLGNTVALERIERDRAALRLLAIKAFQKEELQLEEKHQAELDAAKKKAEDQKRAEAERAAQKRENARARSLNTIAQLEADGSTRVEQIQADLEKFKRESWALTFDEQMKGIKLFNQRIEEEQRRMALEVAQSIGDALSNVTKGFLDTIGEPVRALGSVFGDTFEDVAVILDTTVVPVLDMLGKQFIKLGAVVIKALNLQGPLSKLKKNLEEAAEGGGTAFTRFAAEAVIALGEVGKVAGAVAQGVFALGGSLLGIVEKLTGFSFDPGALVSGAADATLEAQGVDPQATAKEAAKAFVDELVDNAINFVIAMAESLPHLIKRLVARIPDLIQAVVDSIPLIVDAIVTELPGLMQTMADSIEPLVNAIVDAIPKVVDAFVAALPGITTALSDAIPGIIDAILSEIPKILDALTTGVEIIIATLPDVFAAILDNIPGLITAILDGVGRIIVALFDAIPGILQAVINAIPNIILSLANGIQQLLITIGQALPGFIASIISTIPELLSALLGMIPELIQGSIAAIPEIFQAGLDELPLLAEALTALIPDLITSVVEATPAIIEALVVDLLFQLPRIIGEMLKGLVIAVADSAKAIWEALFGGLGSNPFQTAKEDRRGLGKAFGAVGDIFSRDNGGASAFSGINYVPATARITVHPGEAVVTADRNPFKAPGMLQGPATAGAQGGGSGGARSGSGSTLDIAFIAEGRVLDAVQVRSERRGTATEVARSNRRESGLEVGFDRGQFNPFGN